MYAAERVEFQSCPRRKSVENLQGLVTVGFGSHCSGLPSGVRVWQLGVPDLDSERRHLLRCLRVAVSRLLPSKPKLVNRSTVVGRCL